MHHIRFWASVRSSLDAKVRDNVPVKFWDEFHFRTDCRRLGIAETTNLGRSKGGRVFGRFGPPRSLIATTRFSAKDTVVAVLSNLRLKLSLVTVKLSKMTV
jgi:hypothetical protein